MVAMALLQKRPSITIPASTEDSIMNTRKLKKASRKMYVPIRIQTNAIKKEDIAINATYISIEDLTSEDERKKARQKAKNVEVRYLDSIRNLRDKLKSSYSCNKEQCPMLKERLVQHQIEHHSSSPLHRCDRKSQTTLMQPEPECVSTGTINHPISAEPHLKKSVSISPRPSILKRAIAKKHTEHQSMQTTPQYIDFNHATQSYDSRTLKSDAQTDLDHNDLDIKDEFKTYDSKISFVTSNNVMKDDIRNAVMKWYEDIPLYPNFSSSVKNFRKSLINEFIEKIYTHINEENTIDNYENKVKPEIDELLNALPMWYAGAKKDQKILKANIINNLLIKIKDMRGKMYYEKTSNVEMDKLIATNATNQFPNENIFKLIENEIIDWLMQIKLKESEDIGRTINIIDTTNIFAMRIMPLLNKSVCSRNYKAILKSVILDTFNSLPNVFQYTKNNRLYLNHIAEELTNRLLYIQVKFGDSNNCCQFLRDRKLYQMTFCNNSNSKISSLANTDDSFNSYHLSPRFHIIEDVTKILTDCIESIGFENKRKKNDACHKTQNSTESSKTQASIEYSGSTDSIKDALTEDIINNSEYPTKNVKRSYLSSTVTVFNSEQDLSRRSKFPVTSTPKQKTNKTYISKQNPEERAYSKTISNIIEAWMETLPKQLNDDKKFKETIIMDLTGDIVDQIKMEQLIPLNDTDKDKIMYYTIFRWLYRFDIFEDELSKDIPQIIDLQNCLNQVPVPNLNRPKHENRQAMANCKMEASNRNFFVPMGMDILKDEISIWMSELNPDIFSKEDEYIRNKMIQELATSLQNCLVNKRPETEIKNVISNWLKKTLISSEKDIIDKLSENLKNRIMKLPQDNTLAENLQMIINRKSQAGVADISNSGKVAMTKDIAHSLLDVDKDETIKKIIAKYMEHNYDVDDTVARGVFTELLKIEILKLNPPTRKEVYDKFTKPHDNMSPDRLAKELQYIKIVSDWLKNIPIDDSFNRSHNRNRTEIVNDLARNIYEVEQERLRAPTAMDYNLYLASIISQFTNMLPILPEHKGNVMFMIDELIGRIISDRTPMLCCQHTNQANISTDTTGIQEQNVSEFIHHYIHLNAGEFADDQMKLDAWSSRLIKEVKKMIQQTADPSTLCKTQIYNKLINIPIPEDESVRLFNLELGYAKEISDWLKNLPLLPLQTQEANDQRVNMISELAEKFSEWERKKIIDPSNDLSDEDIEHFITHWIRRIPLEPKKEIDISILIPQLLRRIEIINKGTEVSTLQPTSLENSSPIKSKKSKYKINKSRAKQQKCKPSCCRSNYGQAGQVIVDAIEDWSNSLPLRSDNKDADKTTKDNIARILYQKVGDLSVDPQIMNNDALFQELFEDEIDSVLSNLPLGHNIQKKKDSLKNVLLEKVMEAKNTVHEAVAGENYKLLLEKTIETSIPNPKTNKQWYDPGFEIYKNRLADMFILDNFDHGNNAVKIKYEKKIKNEVDKYFKSAQKRNAVPLSKDEIYNELYSALFKVPVPNEISAIAEVEEVKTRCEVDLWFEGLPIQESTDLNELLEWDKILSTLTKRLHEMEKNKLTEDKIHKEIVKWVVRFPLLQGEENNVDKFANDLQSRLNISKEDRKCITSSFKGKEIKSGPKRKGPYGNKSQTPIPNNKDQRKNGSNKLSKTCCQISAEVRKKPTEIVLETVETWCEQLPLPIITAQDEINNKIIRDNLLTQIIIKICALNGDPQIFNDEILYQHFLDVELENLLKEVPICCQFENTKKFKKSQLIGAILQILPLMKEEKACYEYKQELKSTINSILGEPLDTTAQKQKMFDQLKEEIVDNYVQLYYSRDDDEGKQIYKSNLHEVVSKYLHDIRNKADDSPIDPLMKQNQLLCELAKVPIPCERVFQDEVEGIKMKEEVKEFFDSLALPDDAEDKMTLRNNIKNSLSKRLKHIEQTGHNCENDLKMKNEIARCLKKIDLDIAPGKIEAFISKLKDNEVFRKAPRDHNTPVSETLPNYVNSNEHSIRKPNTVQNCDLKNINGDKRNMNPPSEYQEFGEIFIPTSFSLANQVQQNSLRKHSINPTTDTPRDFQNSGSRPQKCGQRQSNKILSRDEEDEEADGGECKCDLRINRRLRRRPKCVLRRKNYCDECDQIRWIPMPYRMPLPRCYFY